MEHFNQAHDVSSQDLYRSSTGEYNASSFTQEKAFDNAADHDDSGSSGIGGPSPTSSGSPSDDEEGNRSAIATGITVGEVYTRIEELERKASESKSQGRKGEIHHELANLHDLLAREERGKLGICLVLPFSESVPRELHDSIDGGSLAARTDECLTDLVRYGTSEDAESCVPNFKTMKTGVSLLWKRPEQHTIPYHGIIKVSAKEMKLADDCVLQQEEGSEGAFEHLCNYIVKNKEKMAPIVKHLNSIGIQVFDIKRGCIELGVRCFDKESADHLQEEESIESLKARFQSQVFHSALLKQFGLESLELKINCKFSPDTTVTCDLEEDFIEIICEKDHEHEADTPNNSLDKPGDISIAPSDVTENSSSNTWADVAGAKDYSISITPADGDNTTGSVDDGAPFTNLTPGTLNNVSVTTVGDEIGNAASTVQLRTNAVSLNRGAQSQCADTDGQEATHIGYREIKDFSATCIQDKGASSEKTEKQKTENSLSLSRVAREFRELDQIFRRGSDLEVVEEGYASKLIDAISSDDEVLMCEALKSLGDLYLQKAKMNQNKLENFTAACALYKESLQNCIGKEEKEVVEHRIRYAEKCTRLFHDQECVESRSETSANLTSHAFLTVKKEMAKMKGQGMMQVYVDSIVKAIVDRNTCLKVESLKGLGDLYVEKGRVGKDKAELTRAVGLYQAALKHCEDADGTETLKHRIKYAKKFKEKEVEKQQERDRQPTGSGKVADELQMRFKPPPTSQQVAHDINRFTIEDLTEDLTEDLDRAELNIVAALKAVHVKGQCRKEAEPLCKLSDVYLKRGEQSKDGGDFSKAVALCNAALVRSKREDQDDIIQSIQIIMQSFLKHVMGITQTVDIDDVEKHKAMLKECRHRVEEEIKTIEQQFDPYSLDDDDPNIREVERKRAETIKQLFQTIVHQRIVFIAGLVDECIKVMGPPPCKYAMIGLGSQATGLVTPYSDLEFAILIEEETENNVKYFRNLTHYLHLKVINLGETMLPDLGIKSLNDFCSDDPRDSWFYDSVTPRGFSFDGAMPHACKTPLGRGKTCELIHTPSNMANIRKDDLLFHLKKGYHLASILGNVCFITGEEDLVDVYNSCTTQQLHDDAGKVPHIIANTILSENVPTFEMQVPTSRLLNVKKAIHQFSSLAVACWALLHDIQPTTIWETIQNLHMKRVINSENAHHLMVMVSISAELRLRAYMKNRGRLENMSALSSMSTDSEMGDQWKKVFYVSNRKQLMRYYYTAIPFQQVTLKLVHSLQTANPPILFDNSSMLQAEVYRSLCDYQHSKSCTEQAIQHYIHKYGRATEHPDIAKALYKLGNIWSNLGDQKKAICYLDQSLQMMQTIYGDNTAHPNIAMALHKLGNIWSSLGDQRKAICYLEKSLQMMRSIYGDNTACPDIAMALNNLGNTWSELGEYRNALHLHEESVQMKRFIYGEDTAHPDIATSLNNLGATWSGLGDHRKAVSYYEQSLKMQQHLYGVTTAYPDIATSLNNLGTAWSDLGDHRKAVSCYEQSLQMQRHIYGVNTAHPDIAASLNNLGKIWNDLGEYRKAIKYCQQSLEMNQSIYGDDMAHPYTVVSLYNLGNAWNNLGDFKKALCYYEQSLQMTKCIYGESTAHPDIVTCLNNLSNAWGNLGDHRKAISYHEHSIQMMQSFNDENTSHPNTVMSHANLGAALGVTSDQKNAVSCQEQSQQKKHSSNEDKTTYSTKNENNFNNCRHFEQTLRIRRCIYG